MADQLTLDVIDRPASGVLAAIRRLQALRRTPPPGVRGVVPLSTGEFVPRVVPSPTLRRVAVLTAWDDGADVAGRWAGMLGPLAAGAREHRHVRGEPARASFSDPCTTSCSAWRTYADAKRYAYSSGRHADAMRRDRAEEHHRTEYFLRVRPLAERGTLDGAAPFAGLLAEAAQPVGVTR